MSAASPHFLLFSESNGRDQQGNWRFVLQAADGSATFEATDTEPDVQGERLELLAVVRGLESLDQPSKVTLVTAGKYVFRGIAYGLDDWRRNGWTWECFGRMVPIKNRDLWQRLDRAMRFHRFEPRRFRIDPPHSPPPCLEPGIERETRDEPASRSLATLPALRVEPVGPQQPAAPRRRRTLWRWSHGWKRLWLRAQCRVNDRVEGWKLACSQLGTSFLPSPWLG